MAEHQPHGRRASEESRAPQSRTERAVGAALALLVLERRRGCRQRRWVPRGAELVGRERHVVGRHVRRRRGGGARRRCAAAVRSQWRGGRVALRQRGAQLRRRHARARPRLRLERRRCCRLASARLRVGRLNHLAASSGDGGSGTAQASDWPARDSAHKRVGRVLGRGPRDVRCRHTRTPSRSATRPTGSRPISPVTLKSLSLSSLTGSQRAVQMIPPLVCARLRFAPLGVLEVRVRPDGAQVESLRARPVVARRRAGDVVTRSSGGAGRRRPASTAGSPRRHLAGVHPPREGGARVAGCGGRWPRAGAAAGDVAHVQRAAHRKRRRRRRRRRRAFRRQCVNWVQWVGVARAGDVERDEALGPHQVVRLAPTSSRLVLKGRARNRDATAQTCGVDGWRLPQGAP
jgi:hypothetical protein